MRQLPEICVSLCGAVALVLAVLVVPAWRTVRTRREWGR